MGKGRNPGALNTGDRRGTTKVPDNESALSLVTPKFRQRGKVWTSLENCLSHITDISSGGSTRCAERKFNTTFFFQRQNIAHVEQ